MKRIFFLILATGSCCAKVHESKSYNNHSDAVTAITFDKEGRSIITGSLDGTMCKRGLGQTYEGKVVEGLGVVTHLARIEKYIAAVHEKCDCGLAIAKHPHPEFYNIGDLSYKSSGSLRDGGHNQPITNMAIINGKSMVTADKTGRLVFLYNCMRSVVTSLDIPIKDMTVASPSRIIASTGKTNAIITCDPELNTWRIKWASADINKVNRIAALKHYLLAFTTQNNKVMLLNGKTGADIAYQLGEHDKEIVAINKINKRLFATADKDGLIKVWNAKKGVVEFELKHDEKNLKTNEKIPVTSLAVHWNKGKQEGKIAIGHQNGVTVVWKYDLEDKKEIL